MADEMDSVQSHTPETGGQRFNLVLLAALPLVLLVALFALLFIAGNGLLPSAAPPVEELSIQRITLPEPGQMVVEVTNGGPDPVTVAQVMVDEAYWMFSIDGEATIPRLGSETIRIPYPWVETEPHEVVLVTSTGVTFDGAVDVSLAEPERNLSTLLRFLLLGFYVGVIPVALGMLWLPVLKQIGDRSMVFVLSLTVGLLAFLLVDTFEEALELAALAPSVFNGFALVLFVALLTVLIIEAVGSHRGSDRTPMQLATLIALGIGLHNFGEGLAIATAYTTGAATLGTFLVVGFTLHNLTEGLAIVAPLSNAKPRLGQLAALTMLAGAPAMLGTWIGAYTYSPFTASLFLAVGAGAIAQVLYQVAQHTKRLAKDTEASNVSWQAIGGFALGVAIMFLTALIVTA